MTGLISFGFSIAMIPWRAFVLFKLWGWFVVPLYPHLLIPKWNLYGIAMMLAYCAVSAKYEENPEIKWHHVAIMSFIHPAVYLLVGWLIKIICL